MTVAEVVLDEIVVVAQIHAEGMAVEPVERVPEPFVAELHFGVVFVGLPLGTHLPEDVQCGSPPVVHPSVPVAVVAVHLILEAVSDLVGHGLSAARGVCPVGEREQSDLVVDAAAAGFPFGGVAQADDHLVGVGLRLALVDGDVGQLASVEFEDAVGVVEDFRHCGGHAFTVAGFPEEYPVLRLHGAVVAPLAGLLLQLLVGAAGVDAAVDFLVHSRRACLKGVVDGGDLRIGLRVVVQLCLGCSDVALEAAEGGGFADHAFPPRGHLFGIFYA